ncbi:MAG TPA: membrane protein insertion efficiency factor YidD [Conexibacter sp.]
MSVLRSVLRAVVLAPIRAYRRVVSPLLPPRCKYAPTCSHYAEQAVREYGILRGLILAGWRLLRCNPWSHGGYDPVHEQRLFRPRPRRSTAPSA